MAGLGDITSDQIARMSEVEITSEFMVLMMDGFIEKDNTLLSAYYREFDDEFPDEREVAARFRAVMDYIELTFSGIISRFRSRTLFYALFVTVYGLQMSYGNLPIRGLSRMASSSKPMFLWKNISQTYLS